MSYPTQTEIEGQNYGNNNVDAGYPEFSAVHDYPNPYIETKKYKKQQQYYDNPKGNIPKQNVNKQKKNKKKNNQTEPKQAQYQQPVLLPPANLYMSQGGHKYMAVPVGKPKLMPVVVPKKKTPKYQMAPQPIFVAQPMYVPQPIYQAQPMYQAQPYGYPYPYYGQTQPIAQPIAVIPPGYKRDYTPNYSPYGDLAGPYDY